MRVLTVLLTFLLILTACATPAQPTIGPVEVTTPESHTVITDGTLKTSLLVTLWKNNSEGSILLPIDPATGTALPNYAPISLGRISFPALSPDRHTLAVVSFSNDNADHGSLLLIDLPSWKIRRFEPDLTGYVNTMVFSRDGKRLAIAQVESQYPLTVIDVERGVITAQSQEDFLVTHLKFTKNGEALMAYSPAINSTSGLNAGPPHVLLLDAADLSPRWSAELKKVHDGLFPKDKTVTQDKLYEPGNAFYLNPGLDFAPDQDTLYIVHADSEQLTTVDFDRRTVKTIEIEKKLSWLEQLLSFSTDVAHAKGEDGTSKQAVVSPDGQLLYVVGIKSTSSRDKQFNLQTEQTPLGLEILQTSDGSRVRQLDTDATELSLSPGGSLLYLRKWGESEPWTEIYNTSNLQLIAHKAKIYATPTLLINGEFLLASTYSTSQTSNYLSVLEPDGSRELSNWTSEDYVSWLTP